MFALTYYYWVNKSEKIFSSVLQSFSLILDRCCYLFNYSDVTLIKMVFIRHYIYSVTFGRIKSVSLKPAGGSVCVCNTVRLREPF